MGETQAPTDPEYLAFCKKRISCKWTVHVHLVVCGHIVKSPFATEEKLVTQHPPFRNPPIDGL